MAGVRARDRIALDEDVDQRDELPGRDLAGHDLVRRRQEVTRLRMLACERAEDELRHRHVGGRLDSVPGHVTEDNGEPAVRQREEVVDVPADVDPRGGLVDGADLQPLYPRLAARQQRALHRVRKLFCCW